MSKKTLIKNRAPAPIQITAEQLLREAQERQEDTRRPVKRRITDQEELDDYRLTKRKTFEDQIRRQRQHLGIWLRYAEWEASQGQFRRARSIYERALDVDYKTTTVWLKYAEMEMSNQFVNHARNVWDRAVTLLPRINQFWYKYAFMEEILGNIDNARSVFDRWMEWEPEETAWYSYIKFEKRQNDTERTRQVYEKFIRCHAVVKSYVKYAMWEEKSHRIDHARKIYERALQELPKYKIDENYYIQFAKFEERCKEYERARAIYQYALNLDEEGNTENQMDEETSADRKEQALKKTSLLYQTFSEFEKKYGNHNKVYSTIVAKRKLEYKKQLQDNPYDYDVWFEYIKLKEEACGFFKSSNNAMDLTKDSEEQYAVVREVYEQAISKIPLTMQKDAWRRYIYLWIKYALFEELIAANSHHVEDILRKALEIIPHKQFTFSKIWILLAEFFIRQYDLISARVVLGQAIGQNPRRKLFLYYIGLERKLGEIQRCRILYEKYLIFDASSTKSWIEYAKMESSLNEYERAKSIYELGIDEEELDVPEALWKSYIDYEIKCKHADRVIDLYERLLRKTKHVKVWLSYAKYVMQMEKQEKEIHSEGDIGSGLPDGTARKIFERAYEYFRAEKMNELRADIVFEWRRYEEDNPDGKVDLIADKIPKSITKIRAKFDDAGEEVGTEEYTDYVFTEDDQNKATSHLLSAAAQWKKKKLLSNQSASS